MQSDFRLIWQNLVGKRSHTRICLTEGLGAAPLAARRGDCPIAGGGDVGDVVSARHCLGGSAGLVAESSAKLPRIRIAAAARGVRGGFGQVARAAGPEG